MKIIYLHQFFKFPNEAGGTRSFDLAVGFQDLGHQVELVTSSSDKKYMSNKRWSKIEKNGLIVHYIYIPFNNNMSYYKRSKAFIKFLYFSTLKLLSMNGDLILATSTPLTVGIPALVKKWVHKKPFVFEVRDVWPEAVIAIGAIKNKLLQKILLLLEHLIYKNALAIVPLSTDMKESIISRYPKLINRKIKTIENISEINRFQKGFDKETSILQKKIGLVPRFTILYAGTFGRVNGLKYVVELAHKLFHLDPTIVFVLIGNGVEKQIIIEKAIEKKILNKNIFIFDSISKQELPQIYYECNMGSSFVIPIKELWANSANKFFDTLAAGKPILINYCGWQKEQIDKVNIGYVLPTIINNDALKKFVLYTRDEKLITTQQKNALNKAKKSYSKDIALSRYNNIFVNIKK